MIDQILAAALVVGVVNVAGILIPTLNSQAKVALALVVGIVVQYVPFDFSPVLRGIELALASSGFYKGLQVLGNKA